MAVPLPEGLGVISRVYVYPSSTDIALDAFGVEFAHVGVVG